MGETDTSMRSEAKNNTRQACNSWIIRLGKKVHLDRFSVSISYSPHTLQGVLEGDGALILQEQSGQWKVYAFARIFRKRSTIEQTTFYFNGFIKVDSIITTNELNIPLSSITTDIIRLDWAIFKNALKIACDIDFLSFPIIKQQDYLRELLQLAVMDDLLGPANGPFEEIIGMSVRDRYLVGKLAPRSKENEIIEVYHKDCEKNNVINPEKVSDEHIYTGRHLPGEEFVSISGKVGSDDTEDESSQEVNESTNQSLVPSSMGLTFCVEGTIKNLRINVSWGRYVRGKSEQINEETGKPYRAWKRIPSGGAITISLDKKEIGPCLIDENCPEVVIHGSVSTPLKNGDQMITIFLVNSQIKPEQNQDQAWVFQPEIIIRDIENRAIFRRRPVLEADGTDKELESLEMIYRNQVEFAVGHGISVHATVAEHDKERAIEVRTSILPQYEVPITETPGLEDTDRPAMQRMVREGLLDMEQLASMDQEELKTSLSILTDDYELWINEQNERSDKDVKGYDDAANEAIVRCKEVLKRLKAGIEVLALDVNALKAFQFANRAMSSQRIHSIFALAKRRGEDINLEALNIPKNRSWRPFQLAFMLLSIPALANPNHYDRTETLESYADLLWFPTGGGKTEAYLGVAAFTMAIRRLQDNLGGFDGKRGLAVIMRYTLRLLTLQQFQRATTLICAMEVLRRDNPETWGIEPFTIGLWVGERVTPNTTESSHGAVEKERDGKYGSGSSPAQLTSCPWCGSEISPGRDIKVDKDIGRTIIYCGDKYGKCEFSTNKSKKLGIPVLVVDEELYRRPPTMLIATVDKFALMAWRGEIRTLFGKTTQECSRHGLLWPEAQCTGNHPKKGTLSATKVKEIQPIRPPDLIIQDEFHLISGPLGTMVALYETAIDELATWKIGDKFIKPKIIASTATVRKAKEQVNNVFLREISVFPPHGLDVEDNFFSVQRSIVSNPGRRYLGICSHGNSRPAILIRVYVALLTAAQAIFERFGSAADPYMTVVGYFNSLRELGGMRRLAEDDVQTRSYRVEMSDVTRSGLSQRSVKNINELTSRVSNKDIPKILDQLEVKFKADWDKDKMKFKTNWNKDDVRALDIVLATNMLSVGVDVNRLGLMVVNGQPKNTAEYIQATSRVGRSFPGLVCTVLTWARPRDLSHYETFEHYHATFYKHVEAQSVTPFAPRALDRGLSGTLVSLLRLNHDDLNPNIGANMLNNSSRPEVQFIKKIISDRAWKVINTKIAKQQVEMMINERIDHWAKEANKAGRRLGYETKKRQGDVAALLKKPSISPWDKFTVPMSMREVEPGVNLIIDISMLPEPPVWRLRVPKDKDGGR